MSLAVYLALLGPLAPAEDCSALGQIFFVRDTLDDEYLWYRELPSLHPALYDSPEAYLEAVRYRPLDRGFSNITPKATREAIDSDSQFYGIGFGLKALGPDELRVTEVFPDGPAQEAGFRRGDQLLAVDGRPVPELLEAGELGIAFRPDSLAFTWRRLDGQELSAVVPKRLFTIPPVSHDRVIDVGGLPVGYLHFRIFNEPAIPALNEAFGDLRRAGVVDLVLDLRYNGGGLLDVAQHLASLIGGMRTNGNVFAQFLRSDKKASQDFRVFFEDPAEALDLARVVVITDQFSLSASEVVVNGLDPFIPVTLVGRRTGGKPVGQQFFEFCEKVLAPVTFRMVNAEGEGDFFDGLPVDCPMRDGIDSALGDPAEASLAEALVYLRDGSCSANAESALGLPSAERPLIDREGSARSVNAW